MLLNTTTCIEEVGLSAVLRSLAVDARRIIAAGSADPREIASICRRIRRLRDQTGSFPPSPLQRWLDGLQRTVEGLDNDRAAS